ncbi:hypothetical protein BS47DRAFT_1364385 [Hydnum rufescens UP504]|uniref:Uncharacterized protein n=1 Tax=Hydnum rufescens UP504 TaxID=1448309 RepID=A0A9P6ARI5_9AGAM|nr:hypothetical protein BS47DRAFT_1364385 [Hydnum rufescens UP504]
MEVAQFLFAHGALVQSNRLSFIPPPVLDRYLVFIIYPYELDNQQDPTELEQDHTPAMAGLRLSRITMIQNKINTGRNPSKTPHTCAAPKPTRRQIKHGTTHLLRQGNVSNGNASNEHTTDENTPSKWPWEPHPPRQYHTPAAAGVWYYKVLDSNPNEPLTPNPPNKHPVNEDPGPQGPLGCLRGCLGAP